MTIDPRLLGIKEFTFIPDGPLPAQTKDVNTTFDDMFKAALDVINETNTLQVEAEQLQVDFATGRTDDVLSVLLAQDKAYSALNFTVQVTNKIIESYREIMRMQI
jgi:flagellar hook-basal body complex protein FliE